jgi:hypothetical protein
MGKYAGVSVGLLIQRFFELYPANVINILSPLLPFNAKYKPIYTVKYQGLVNLQC